MIDQSFWDRINKEDYLLMPATAEGDLQRYSNLDRGRALSAP